MNSVSPLRQLAQATGFDSEGLLTWFGHRLGWPSPVAGEKERSRLQALLYDRFYCAGRPTPLAISPARIHPFTINSLASAFDMIARTRTIWQADWQPLVHVNGQVLVKRDGVAAWCPEMRVRQADEGILVEMPAGRPALTPGFYYFAMQSRRQAEPGIRLYWSLTSDAAVRFVASALEAFADREINFKVLVDPHEYWRTDACVMYMSSATLRANRGRVRAFYAAMAGALDEGTPALTRRLAPGLSWAETPADGGSFGENLCSLLTDALAQVVRELALTTDQRLDVLRDALLQAGVDPRRLHLRRREQQYAGPSADQS